MWSASLSGRAVSAAGQWLAWSWKHSLTRRAFRVLGRVLAWFAASSRLLSVREGFPIGLSELADSSQTGLFGYLVGRAYLAQVNKIGGGLVGRAARRLERSLLVSVLAGSGWLGLLGPGLLAGGVAILLGASGGAHQGRERLIGALLAAAGLVGGIGGAFHFAGALRLRSLSASQVLLGFGAAAGAVLAGALAGRAGSSSFFLLLAAVCIAVGLAVSLFRGELLLLVLAFFPWIDWAVRGMLGQSLGGFWDEGLLVWGLIVVGWGAVVLRRHELRSIPILVPGLCGLVAAVASVVLRDVPDQVALFALRITFQPLFFFVLGLWLPKNRRCLSLVVTFFLAGSVLMAIHGLYQYLTDAPMPASWVDIHEDIGTRAYSIIGNPNGLGAFLLLSVFVAGAFALSAHRWRERAVYGTVAVVLLCGLAVTFSRGAYLGLAVGFVAMVLLGFKQWAGRLVLGALVALAFVPRRFCQRLLFALSPYYLQLSQTNGRLYVWRIALLRMVEHPWTGVGLGTLGGTSAYLAGYSRLWTDNYYLQLASEGGLLLLLAFLWVLARAGKSLVAAHRASQEPSSKAFVAGVFGGFVAVCVSALTVSAWETLAVAVGFWTLVGLAVAPEDDILVPSAEGEANE